MYDVIEGYWNYGDHVVAVTDDPMFAREEVLRRITRALGGLDHQQFACFERAFTELMEQGKTMYLSIQDYHFGVRESTLTVAVGGMSTIGGGL